MTKRPVIVEYVHRPKRPIRKRPTKPQAAAGEPVSAIVTAARPGKPVRRPQVSDGPPASDSVREFYARMIKPPGP